MQEKVGWEEREFGNSLYEITISWNLENEVRPILVREQRQDRCVEVGEEQGESCTGQPKPVLWEMGGVRGGMIYSSTVLYSRFWAH